jgi:3'-phosphoadenosine 5'-phosphosulfate (PAPS) 3'-phosphatase
MKLSTDDLLALHQTAISAATEAGCLIAERASQSVDVLHKTGGDSLASQVLTEADLASEAVILKCLQPSCKEYDIALLTEETTDNRSRLEKECFWCVDPMDGTLCFIQGTAGYSVSIGLLSRDGTPLMGVVYDPISSTLYSAVKGQGAMFNRQQWSPDLNDSIQGKPLTVICDRGFMQKKFFPNIKQALENTCESLGLSELKIIDKGAGAVMNALWVIENQPACYFKIPKPEEGGGSLWDFAASAAVFQELNAVATDFHGQPLQLNRAESTFMNHRGVMFASHPVLAEALRSNIMGNLEGL